MYYNKNIIYIFFILFIQPRLIIQCNNEKIYIYTPYRTKRNQEKVGTPQQCKPITVGPETKLNRKIRNTLQFVSITNKMSITKRLL